MIGIGDWVVKMIFHRLRGLGVQELKDLIKHSDEMETLQTLKGHLLSGNFKWANVTLHRDELLKMVNDRAHELTEHIWGG